MNLEYSGMRFPDGYKGVLKSVEIDDRGFTRFTIEFTEVCKNIQIEKKKDEPSQ